MILAEMFLEGIVVDVVLLLAASRSSVTDMAALMFVPTMQIELIVAVESLMTETTFRMPLKSALVYRSRIIVTEFFVFS